MRMFVDGGSVGVCIYNRDLFLIRCHAKTTQKYKKKVKKSNPRNQIRPDLIPRICHAKEWP